MKIEMWADIICPWCGLGQHRLSRALERFVGGKDVELAYRSFQLDESMPLDKTVSVREMLRVKLGLASDQIESVGARIQGLARQEGLEPYLVLDNRVGNTSRAHELAAWATSIGQGRLLWDALYKTYFREARSVFDIDSLVALAQAQGFDVSDARAVLETRRFSPMVRQDQLRARELGIKGVPFVLVDGRYAVPGAQPVETLLSVLEAARGR